MMLFMSFIVIFSYFAFAVQRAEAVVVIPFVAIPIIKLLIACGVTFLTVDAMLEAYNFISKQPYYKTLSGDIIDYLEAEFMVSGGDPGDPKWGDLVIGTLSLGATFLDSKLGNFFDWIMSFFTSGDHLIVDNVEVPWGTKVNITGDGTYIYNGISFRVYNNQKCVQSCGFQQCLTGFGIVRGIVVYKDFPYTQDGFLKICFYVDLSENITLGEVPSGDYLDDDFVDFDYVGDDVLDTGDFDFYNENTDKDELFIPIPGSIVDLTGSSISIDPNSNITVDEFTEIMTTYVNATPSTIQTEFPVPFPEYVDPELPVIPDPTIPDLPDDDAPADVPSDFDNPFENADPGKKINWDPLKGVGLHKKFPFCIPWDLASAFSSFNVPGEAPVWQIDFLSTNFTIDFSIFEEWAKILRWGVLLLFNIGLIRITRDIIRG